MKHNSPRKKLFKKLGLLAMCGSSFISAQALNPLTNPALNKVRLQKAPVHAPVELIKNGKAEAVVVIPALPPSKAKNKKAMLKLYALNKKAANDLIKYLKEVTGASLPLQTSDQPIPKGKKLILLGESPLTKAKGISTENLPLEGFKIQTFDNGVAIVGRLPGKQENYNLGGGYYTVNESAAQSLYFGVYDFLERFCGIRWYYPGANGTYIPHKQDIIIPPCTYTDWPEFKKRTGAHWIFYTPAKSISNFAGTRKFSRYFRAGDSSYVEFGCHSPLNFGIHAAKQPECFELSNSGKRDSSYPCYGNPETAKLMFEDLVNFYEKGDKRPYLSSNSGKPWCAPTEGRVVVSPPDKPVACNCKFCRKLWRKSLGSMGNASEVLAQFTKNYAEMIAKKWTDKKVLFLPYMNYLTCPPSTILPDNVVPFVCLTYGTANQKEKYVMQYNTKALRDWSKAVGGNKVLIWEYLCWPAENTSLPFQYPHVIKDFYQKNRDKILGTFVDGHLSMKGKRAFNDKTPGGEWTYSHPTIYCWYRLMWNPDFDVDAALDEYCDLMYGTAASPMKKIMKILTDRWEKTVWKDKIEDHNVRGSQINNETMPPTEVKKLAALLKQAESLSEKGSEQRKRVDFFGAAIKKFLKESHQYHNSKVPEMYIKKVGDNPVIDGKLNDSCWRSAVKYYTRSAYTMEKKGYHPTSIIRAVWTEQGITFGIINWEAFESIVKYNKKDDRIYDDESVELFLQCSNNPAYFQIIVNPLGAYLDAKGQDISFNFEDIKVASEVNRRHKYWSCEIFIPFKELGIKPVTNLEFTGNVARNRNYIYRKAKQRKLYRWHTTFRLSHNDSSAFGKMKLVE
jgi:hypothetical protein